MAEPQFYSLIFNHQELEDFLVRTGLIITSDKINDIGLQCRNPRCPRPTAPFKPGSRNRNLTAQNAAKLKAQGEEIQVIPSLRHTGCWTRLSPRTKGFLSYYDHTNRANSKLSPVKVLQIMWYWINGRSHKSAVSNLGIFNECVADWFFLMRELCEKKYDMVGAMNPGGNDLEMDRPLFIFQIDEVLMRGKKKDNREWVHVGDQRLTEEDRDLISKMDANDACVDYQRNYGRRVFGPWIFGIAMCELQENGTYETVETRFFWVRRRDADNLLPIIRQHIAPGNVIWSDQWPEYGKVCEGSGLQHVAVDHTQYLVDPVNGAHTKNIELEWETMRKKLIRSMRGTNDHLLESHLAEYWWRSTVREVPVMEKFVSLCELAAEIHPVTW